MSIYAAIGSALKGVASVALPAIGSAIGSAIGGGGRSTTSAMPGSGARLPISSAGMMGGLPALGRAALPALRRAAPIAAAVGGGIAVDYVFDRYGRAVPRRRRRRMNVCNIRALNRSLRRVEGFERVARRVLTISHGRAPAKMRYKRRRKRSCR